MSAPDARVRGLSYAGLYYESALAGIEAAAAVFMPWHTEQDPHDPINGLKRLVAYMAHRDGSLLDRIGSGLFWPTFLTRAEAIALAAGIGYRLERDRPAAATLVGKLQLDVVGSETIVPEGAQFLAPGDGQTPGVTFEAVEALVSVETDFAGSENDSGVILRYSAISGLFTEFVQAEGGGGVFATGALSDALYFGHPNLAFVGLDVTFQSVVARDCVWELYDPSYQFAPGPDEADDDAAVYDLGDGRLRFRLEDYAAGARLDDGVFSVSVTCLLTGRAENIVVEHDNVRGAVAVSETTFGQESPSVEPADYVVKPGWVIPLGLDDGTVGCSQSGRVAFVLPVTYRYEGELVERKWAKTSVNGTEAFWLRVRRTGATSGSSSVIATGGVDPIPAADGGWWAVFDVVQGVSETVDAGESTGAAFQRFEVPVEDLIEGSLRVFVVAPSAAPGDPGVEWTLVASLYATEPTDNAATLVEEPDGRLFVVFGDGSTNGAVPAEGSTVRLAYRRGAARNGDVGAETIRLALDGTVPLGEITNPRGASGWAVREGGTDLDLERVRLSVPATVRVGERIVTHEDASAHAQRWQAADGRRPVARAESADSLEAPDAITVYTLGSDGYPLAETDRAALELALNGRRVGLQRIGGLVAANVVAYVRAIRVKAIDLSVVVYVLPGYSAGVEAAVKANLRAYLHPLSVRGAVLAEQTSAPRGSPGTWQHRLGQSVSRYAIGAVVSDAAGAGFSDATVTFGLGGTAVPLDNDELPIAGSITVTVTEVE